MDWYDGYRFGLAEVYSLFYRLSEKDFHEVIKQKDLSALFQALTGGDADKLQTELSGLLMGTISYTDVCNYGVAFFKKQCRVKVRYRKLIQG